MTVLVNGVARTVPDGTTIAELLAGIGPGLDRRGVAVAVDGEVVPRSTWPHATLVQGARVEVLDAIQGG